MVPAAAQRCCGSSCGGGARAGGGASGAAPLHPFSFRTLVPSGDDTAKAARQTMWRRRRAPASGARHQRPHPAPSERDLAIISSLHLRPRAASPPPARRARQRQRALQRCSPPSECRRRCMSGRRWCMPRGFFARALLPSGAAASLLLVRCRGTSARRPLCLAAWAAPLPVPLQKQGSAQPPQRRQRPEPLSGPCGSALPPQEQHSGTGQVPRLAVGPAV